MSQQKSRPSWIGQTVGGRYKIEAQLGQGGMSTVYQATDPNLQRTVAVKLIHPHLSSDSEFVRRFEQEAAAVAQLRHPNIIQVYDFNHDADLYYMVLEYVPGETLQDKLKSLTQSKEQFSINDTIRIMSTVCDAVGYAHEQGMIHRDLKPANVMLNLKGQPILMDFGVAKMLDAAHHTATGAIIGTAKYMSPEQARGDRPDNRTDIYSLGVMLYEMVAGIPPYDADSTVALLMKHVSEPLPDIRQVNPDVSPELAAVIEKSLAKNREDRFQSAHEMATALRRISQNAPTVATTAPDATVLQPAHTPAASTATAAPAAPAAKQPAKKGGFPIWLVGAGAILLLLIVGAAGFFIFSGSGNGEAEGEGVPVAGGGEPALPSAEGMIRIPEGNYTVGVDQSSDNYAPIQQVELDQFFIDQYEVSNAHYAQFVSDTGHQPPEDWNGNMPPTEEEDHPVDGVSWDSAVAYCQWTNKRLPTEAEWEVAARGTEQRLFPWGNNQSVVPLPAGGTYPVGGKPTNQSSFGVFDMAGNVWEWVGESYAPIEQGNQVLRGGANGFLQNMAYRLQGDPNTPTMMASAGIRCAADQVNITEDKTLAEGVLASDDFVDPGSGWPILTEGNFLYGYHPPAFYHVQVNKTDDHISVSRDPALSDFTVETDVQVFSANTTDGNFRYGLTFRRDGEQYYAFVISPRAGTWDILKSSAGGIEALQSGTIDTLKGIAPAGFTPDSDQIDTLRVDAEGPEFLFHINNETVAYLSDSDYASGEIGFYVQNYDETLSHIHYDVFTIREVDYDPAVAETLAAAAPSEQPTEAVEEEPDESEEEQITESDTLATATPEPTTATEPAEEATPEPTPEEATPTPTNTPAPTPTPEPTLSFSTAGMVEIPAGYFLMGSSSGEAIEAPEHPVLLDGFYIDQTEVTNVQYRDCVDTGPCSPAQRADAFTYTGYRDSPEYDDYPVVSVTWDQAQTYCTWAGKRLPTEAEWEYAASGPENLTWPWGNSFNVNLSAASADDVQPVGSYPEGASPFGVLDMAGNVAEWVADTFDDSYYANSPASNPANRSNGSGRIYRGGSFGNPDGSFFTTSKRYGNTRDFSEVDVGFRCAGDAPNSAPSDDLVAEFCQLYADYNPGGACP